jgi:hypothetical protein
VEKIEGKKFSEFSGVFPQVFHTSLWTPKAKRSKTFATFCTYPQALFLLLDLDILELLRYRSKAGERENRKLER